MRYESDGAPRKIQVMRTIQPLCRGDPAYDMIEVITVMKLVTEMLVMAYSYYSNLLVVRYCQVIANNLLKSIIMTRTLSTTNQSHHYDDPHHYRYDIHQVPLKMLKNDAFMLRVFYNHFIVSILYLLYLCDLWKKYTHEINPKV